MKRNKKTGCREDSEKMREEEKRKKRAVGENEMSAESRSNSNVRAGRGGRTEDKARVSRDEGEDRMAQ